MMLDTVLNVAVYVLPVALAMAGVYVTLYPPDQQNKRPWWVAILGLCIITLVAIVWQQNRASEAGSKIQADNASQQNELRASLHSNELTNQYLRGQIDTMSTVLGQVAAGQGDSNTNGKLIVSVLGGIAKQASVSADTRSALERSGRTAILLGRHLAHGHQ